MQKILFSWLAMLQFAHAQITFNKVYNIDSGVEIGLSVIELSDGYLFYGEGNEYPELPLDAMMVLFKTDFEGNVLWHKKYGKEYQSWLSQSNNIFPIDSENVFVFCNIKDFQNNGKITPILINFNSIGDTVWIKRYNANNSDVIRAGIRHPSGEFYFTGITRNFGDLSGDVWLVKTDSAGNMLWQKKYGVNGENQGFSIQLSNDNQLIIGAGTYVSPSNLFDPWLIHTDTSGNVLWNKRYGTNGIDCGASVASLTDGGYVLVSCIDTIFSAGFDDAPNQIIRIDSVGDTIWRKIFDNSIERIIRQHRQIEDGSIIFAGEIAEQFGNSRGWFFKLDTDGNLIWERIINTPFNRTAAIYDFQETSDGGFICTGNPVGAYNNSDFWLLKLDANGCDTTNCIASVATLSKPKHEIHLFPNPATDKIFVCIKSSNRQHAFKEATLKLYDTSGKEVYNHVATLNIASYSEYYLNITNFQQGIYYYNISVANEIIGKGKLVKH